MAVDLEVLKRERIRKILEILVEEGKLSTRDHAKLLEQFGVDHEERRKCAYRDRELMKQFGLIEMKQGTLRTTPMGYAIGRTGLRFDRPSGALGERLIVSRKAFEILDVICHNHANKSQETSLRDLERELNLTQKLLAYYLKELKSNGFINEPHTAHPDEGPIYKKCEPSELGLQVWAHLARNRKRTWAACAQVWGSREVTPFGYRWTDTNQYISFMNTVEDTLRNRGRLRNHVEFVKKANFSILDWALTERPPKKLTQKTNRIHVIYQRLVVGVSQIVETIRNEELLKKEWGLDAAYEVVSCGDEAKIKFQTEDKERDIVAYMGEPPAMRTLLADPRAVIFMPGSIHKHYLITCKPKPALAKISKIGIVENSSAEGTADAIIRNLRISSPTIKEEPNPKALISALLEGELQAIVLWNPAPLFLKSMGCGEIVATHEGYITTDAWITDIDYYKKNPYNIYAFIRCWLKAQKKLRDSRYLQKVSYNLSSEFLNTLGV